MLSRKCSICKLDKNLEEFYYRHGKPIRMCKICICKKVNNYSKTKHGKYIRAMIQSKQRKKEWNINENDYYEIIKRSCYYCNNFFETKDDGVGLDRLDNSKGYLINNVVRCCSFCNYLRGDLLSPEETKAAVNLIITMRQPKSERAE